MFSAVSQSTKRLVRFRYGFVDIRNVKTLRRACFSGGVRPDEGPLRLYKSYLEKQLLKPDDSQSKVVYQLQGLYERLKDYDPQQKSSKLHINLAECESVRSKVVSIDKSRFERRQESVQSVSIELIYQICVKIFSLAVDKRTKNNLYIH